MKPDWFSRFEDRCNWTEFNFNLQIDLRNRYVYFEVAKAACSTIKARLQTVVVGDLFVPKVVHPSVYSSPFAKPYQLTDAMMEDILAGRGMTRFTFVREPVERALSAYLDKICRDTDQKKRFYERHLPDGDVEKVISFEQFLDFIAETRKTANLDKHWRPQSDLMFLPDQEYDFIGRIDRFEADWDKFREIVNLPPERVRRDVTWHATSAKSQVDEQVSPEARRRIETIYARDFDLFESIA